MIIIKEEKRYPCVTDDQHATTKYPNLCTYTVDGKFAFVFCHLGRSQDKHQVRAVEQYINDSSDGKVGYICFY